MYVFVFSSGFLNRSVVNNTNHKTEHLDGTSNLNVVNSKVYDETACIVVQFV